MCVFFVVLMVRGDHWRNVESMQNSIICLILETTGN